MSGRMRQKMEQEKKPYIILETTSTDSLEMAVRNHLKDGYVPLGGVQVVAHRPEGLLTGTVFNFYQTMVFNEV